METTTELAALSSSNSAARRSPRTLYSVPMRLRMLMPGGIRTTRGVSLDVGEGGLGALVENSLKVGDVVEMELSLPKQELNAVGIVRYSNSSRCGFEFLGLTADEHQQLAELVGSTNHGFRFASA
ncbi:MAG TPA: PilZ domain-containing protein [Terriglobales bacterium]